MPSPRTTPKPEISITQLIGDAFDEAARTCPTKQHAAQHIMRALSEAGFAFVRSSTLNDLRLDAWFLVTEAELNARTPMAPQPVRTSS